MKNKIEHTPGPAYVLLDVETGKPQSHNGKYAVHRDSDVIADGLELQQAYLYAAAPELLAALESGEDIISGLEAEADNAGLDLAEVRAWWQAASTAIRRAKGEK